MSSEFQNEYEGEIAALEERLVQTAPPPGTVVFYGSSSIRLWETLQQDMAPLVNGRTVVNLGFGGSTLAECVDFFDRLPGHVNAPRSLVVYAGENDLAQGFSADAVVSAFESLQRRINERFGPLPFAFMKIKPSPGRPEIWDRANEVNARIAAQLGAHPETRLIDTDTPMRSHPGGPARWELFAEDGVHLTGAGYELWTRLLAEQRDFLFG